MAGRQAVVALVIRELLYQSRTVRFRLWIAPVIGDLPMKDVTGFHLERLKKNMADANLTARTIRYALAVIRQVFNFARARNLYNGESPTAKVKTPQADNRRHRFLTRDEADRLFETLAFKSTVPVCTSMAYTVLFSVAT